MGSRGLRLVTLPHHRTCGFPHPAVDPCFLHRAAPGAVATCQGMMKPCRVRVGLLSACCTVGCRAIGQAPRPLWLCPNARPLIPRRFRALCRPRGVFHPGCVARRLQYLSFDKFIPMPGTLARAPGSPGRRPSRSHHNNPAVTTKERKEPKEKGILKGRQACPETQHDFVSPLISTI